MCFLTVACLINLFKSTKPDDITNLILEASRINALGNFAEMELKTGSNLIDQFKTDYLPRVFNVTLPYAVGGPDFRKQERFRRKFEDSRPVFLPDYDNMMPHRCEAQIRLDWDFLPGVRSLAFATKVNRQSLTSKYGSRNR